MQSVRGTLLPFAVVAFLALPVIYGCTKFQEHDTLTSLLKDRKAPGSPPQSPNPEEEPTTTSTPAPAQLPVEPPKPDPKVSAVLRELAPLNPTDYIVEAPDVLQIEVLVRDPKTGKVEQLADPISGTFVVRPDGAVSLGTWGSVSVAGRTLEGAEQRIREHLTKARSADSNAGELRVIVDVHSYNSRRIYIITSSNGDGEQVLAVPFTGNATVLDALANSGLVESANKASIRVVRCAANSTIREILPVDWRAITQQGATTTNYRLQPGDRIYVTSEDE
jgi:polysaccharide export outer membrane protein